MRKIGVWGLAAIFLFAVAGPSFASSWRAANRNYIRGTCHQKIDPKNLKGQPLKDAWKACREATDTYN